jgi:hypothetical protein
VLQALSSIVAASDMDPMAKTRLDGMLTLYTFEFGACGRIYNTAIPFCYTRCVCGLPALGVLYRYISRTYQASASGLTHARPQSLAVRCIR